MAISDEGFMGALKVYRQLDDEWHETPPEKAAEPLGRMSTGWTRSATYSC